MRWKNEMDKAQLRTKVVQLMSDPASMGQGYTKLAAQAGVSVWAFKKALTPAVRAEIEARLAGEVTPAQVKEKVGG